MKTALRHLDLIRDHGRCRTQTRYDTEDFYEDPDMVFEVCAECYVRIECLEYALATDERFGVWGGAPEKDRRVLADYLGPHTAADLAEFYVTTGSVNIPQDLT